MHRHTEAKKGNVKRPMLARKERMVLAQSKTYEYTLHFSDQLYGYEPTAGVNRSHGMQIPRFRDHRSTMFASVS